MIGSFPLQFQHDFRDCGPACLSMISEYYGNKIRLPEIKKILFVGKDGASLLSMVEAGKLIGFTAHGIKLDITSLPDITLPCILHWDTNHYVVLYRIRKGKYYVADPRGGRLKYQQDEFLAHWQKSSLEGMGIHSGIALQMEPTDQFFSNKFQPPIDSGFSILLRYLLKFRKSIILLAISLLFVSSIQLMVPFFTQAIVDVGIKEKTKSIIYLLIFGQLLLFLGEIIGEVIRRWLLLLYSSRINLTIISEFLTKLLKLPLSYFDSKLVADFLQRIDDHTRIEKFLSVSTLNVLFSSFNLVVFSCILIYYNFLIFAVFISISILYVVYILLFMKKRKQLDLKRFGQLKDNNSFLYQLIIGMHEIKLNSGERKRKRTWQYNQIELHKINIESAKLQQVQETGGLFINQAKNIIITFISAISVIDGALTLGMMLAIQNIIGQMNGPLTSILSFLRDFQDARLSLDRIGEVKSIADEDAHVHQFKMDKTNQDIHIRNVSFQYEGTGSPYALRNVSLSIPFGKTTAIVGTSGSGKTTLLKLILKFYKPTEGAILIGENDLFDFSSENWRRNCGSVLQDGFLFSETIEENICIESGHVDRERLMRALTSSNSLEFVNNLPQNVHTKIGMDGSGLSQGQKQRLLIARAIYKDPEYYFFDEATSSLDANNESIIYNNLKAVLNNKTVIIIAHRLSTVKNADQIVVLDNGKVVEVGDHQSLVNERGYYFTLVKNQLELGAD